eukprot:Filipodium_phascolosomae@DN8267_c0_g1_i1.p1
MDATGWIPREPSPGAEAAQQIPEKFRVQYRNIANPPTLLIAIENILTISAPQIAEDGNAIADLVESIDTLIEPVTRWFKYLKSSQQSKTRGCYRWKGRTSEHTLASGLDDFPRGLLVNEDECHLDLHGWLMQFPSTLKKMCTFVESQKQKKSNKELCKERNLSMEWNALNRTLFELFLDPTNKILADYIGKQPLVGTSKALMVAPPWRHDGRCGTDFQNFYEEAATCNPETTQPCCSPSGWCGNSPDHCTCDGCLQFRSLKRTHQLAKFHSPHIGVVSIVPLILGIIPFQHVYSDKLMREHVMNTESLWSPYGCRSLSRQDPIYRSG